MVAVVEAQPVLGQRPHQVHLQPVGEAVGAQVLRLDLEHAAAAQQEQPHGRPLEVREVPDARDGEGQRAVHAHAGPVPDHVERVEHEVEDGQRDEGLVCIGARVQKT